MRFRWRSGFQSEVGKALIMASIFAFMDSLSIRLLDRRRLENPRQVRASLRSLP